MGSTGSAMSKSKSRARQTVTQAMQQEVIREEKSRAKYRLQSGRHVGEPVCGEKQSRHVSPCNRTSICRVFWAIATADSSGVHLCRCVGVARMLSMDANALGEQ